MTLVEEMEGTPRPTPGLMKTIESVISIVRQSRETGAAGPGSATKGPDAADLMRLFKDDLATEVAAPRRGPTRVGMSLEAQEAEDLARIRRALYQD